ncbi:MAG TPA: enoyl-CoA hydratase/isomerase family protein [Gaiellales bacterium]|jgi:thioesterase DpgC|nr:enoyl-CoA hydratase/isomerase family protein [Gaiellales bacterium]
MVRVRTESDVVWADHLRAEAASIYRDLTDGLRKQMRVSELVYAAAERFPEHLPSRAAIAAERELLQKDKQGLEINQGIFVAHVLAEPQAGFHLLHSMSQPTAEAVARLAEFQRGGSVDLGPMRVDREDDIGHVTVQNHAFLNSEDDASTAALEVAIDLVLLDDSIRVGVLRGGPATHRKYAGRRILGSGINLTHLYKGQISLVEFMLERELGLVSKMYRGHDLAPFDAGVLEHRREKPWIAAVDSFAIGGTCQWLLVMDYVVAEQGSYFVLPARKEGIIPGCANLRLPRFVGERIARQALFFNRTFPADSPEGLMLADEVVPTGDMAAAIRHAASEVISAGTTSLNGNRLALRQVQEPLDLFRRYMSNYSQQQAYCLYSPALIDNLERNWDASNR